MPIYFGGKIFENQFKKMFKNILNLLIDPDFCGMAS